MQQQCCTASLLYNSFCCLARGKFCASGETQSKDPWGGIWEESLCRPLLFPGWREGALAPQVLPITEGAEAPKAQRSRKRTPFIGRWRAFLFCCLIFGENISPGSPVVGARNARPAINHGVFCGIAGDGHQIDDMAAPTIPHGGSPYKFV